RCITRKTERGSRRWLRERARWRRALAMASPSASGPPPHVLHSTVTSWHVLHLVYVQSPSPILKNSRESVAEAVMVCTKCEKKVGKFNLSDMLNEVTSNINERGNIKLSSCLIITFVLCPVFVGRD
ncbi:unnamed protein product, partial [Urochloa humidicola]